MRNVKLITSLLSIALLAISLFVPYREKTVPMGVLEMDGDPGYTFFYPQIMLLVALMSAVIMFGTNIRKTFTLFLSGGNLALLVITYYAIFEKESGRVMLVNYEEGMGFYLACVALLLQTNASIFHMQSKAKRNNKHIHEDLLDQE